MFSSCTIWSFAQPKDLFVDFRLHRYTNQTSWLLDTSGHNFIYTVLCENSTLICKASRACCTDLVSEWYQNWPTVIGVASIKGTVILTLYEDYEGLITHDKSNHSSVIELHLIDRANPVHSVRLVTESATDKCTECQVKPNSNACNVTQTQDISVK